MSILSFTIGSWKPGIGDPSFMGWLTVFSYYFTALMCFLKMFSKQLPQDKKEWQFWSVICFSMIILGLIKQFNLLSALTEIGRIIARSNGWLEQRTIFQVWVMVLVVFVAFISSATIYHALSKSALGYYKITVIGFAYLLLFVTLRAISLHQFGMLLDYKILGARVNWIAELIGIYWICLSIFWKRGRLHDR